MFIMGLLPDAGFRQSGKTYRSIVTALLTVSVLYATGASAQQITRGPYLQKATTSSIIIHWRTGSAVDSKVFYGTDPDNLNMSVEDLTSKTEHILELTGLTQDTRYYYSVGTTSAVLASDETHTFQTFPTPGVDHPTRIWVEGDSGKYNWTQWLVRDAYNLTTSPRPADVWLMLGDNAYTWGRDWEHQEQLFDVYPKILRSLALWPSLGNHEYYLGSAQPYFNIFDLPTAGEAGGIPSGTEEYFSHDYGDIHFINLNSMQDDLTTNGPMLTWLENDLAANDKYWVIAYWHHLPYATGGVSGHLSDAMRMNALPILEAYGVDVVLTGHYHNYRRTKLLNGHYGASPYRYESANVLDRGDGKEDGDGAYIKPGVGGTPNEGAVYVLAGSSGQIAGNYPIGPLSHPSFAETAWNKLGSVVIDIAGNRLEYKWIDDEAIARDYFTIIKGPDTFGPALTSAQSAGTDKVVVQFSEDVDATDAATAANYAIPGIAVSAATVLSPRTVELETSSLTLDTRYTVTATGISDLTGNGITANNSQEFKADTRLPGDADADGMADIWEFQYELDYTDPTDAAGDLDNDGVTNLQEFLDGSIPNVSDTDGDGLGDGDEISIYGTDPDDSDTDDDGMPDGWEVTYELEPTDPADAAGDLDNDALSNLLEYQNNSDPTNKYTDSDWINDYFEVTWSKTDPTNPDTDGDGMDDFFEAYYWINPNNPDSANWDNDSDGLNNLEEYNRGTKVLDADSDGDGMPDGWEVTMGINPLFPSADRDPDLDGLDNLPEMNNGTDPQNPDSDNDGLLDGAEIANSTNPLLRDTDGDFVPDGYEVNTLGTDPLNSDTDSDGMPDFWESINNTGPTDPNSGNLNPDGDAYVNLQEYQNGTNPNVADP